MFTEMRSIEINPDAEPGIIAKAVATRLYERLGITGYKQSAKRDWWALVVHTAKQAYDAGACLRFSRNLATATAIQLQVIDAAVAAGYLDETRSTKGGKHMSRLMPTAELERELDKLPEVIDDVQLVQLREPGSGEELPFDPNHPVAVKVARKLARINQINERHEIHAQVGNALSGRSRCLLHPVHFAVFHPDWEHGRLYTGKDGHQALEDVERATIKFDGEPSVELDFTAFHTRMLYHLEGFDLDGDPYHLWPNTDANLRGIAKITINTALNADTRQSALAACYRAMSAKTPGGAWKQGKGAKRATILRKIVPQYGLKFANVYDLAVKKHRLIRKHFGTGAGRMLMTLDAKIALAVMSYFAKRCIPILGEHDSFVVPAHAEGELRTTMEREYEKRIGRLPVIKTTK